MLARIVLLLAFLSGCQVVAAVAVEGALSGIRVGGKPDPRAVEAARLRAVRNQTIVGRPWQSKLRGFATARR